MLKKRKLNSSLENSSVLNTNLTSNGITCIIFGLISPSPFAKKEPNEIKINMLKFRMKEEMNKSTKTQWKKTQNNVN